MLASYLVAHVVLRGQLWFSQLLNSKNIWDFVLYTVKPDRLEYMIILYWWPN